MANKTLFAFNKAQQLVLNRSGGVAHKLSDEAALAQLAMTGTFNNTFYVSAKEQLTAALALAEHVSPEFLARTAVIARRFGYMKDLPATLGAVLIHRSPELFAKVAPKVYDNGRMVRNLFQICTSGQIRGRKHVPKPAQRFLRNWLVNRHYNRLFDDAVGDTPSIATLIKMVHPKPKDEAQSALFSYLCGFDHHKAEDLPDCVTKFEAFKAAKQQGLNPSEVPNVEFRRLSALKLTTNDWVAIAMNGGWQMVRMNLNTFERHGVFKDPVAVKVIADKLANAELIRRSKVMPFQILQAFLAAEAAPILIRNGLEAAMEIAASNVPKIDGPCYVFPDASGSMLSNALGSAKCIQIAALVAAAFLRSNSTNCEVMPFGDCLPKVNLDSSKSIMTIAQQLSAIRAGGTRCSLPLAELNRRQAEGNLIVYVSDNESWIDRPHGQTMTETEAEWLKYKNRNPKAQMVCVDITPGNTTQVPETREGVYNVGGFSDVVFDFISAIHTQTSTGNSWVEMIRNFSLD